MRKLKDQEGIQSMSFYCQLVLLSGEFLSDFPTLALSQLSRSVMASTHKVHVSITDRSSIICPFSLACTPSTMNVLTPKLNSTPLSQNGLPFLMASLLILCIALTVSWVFFFF